MPLTYFCAPPLQFVLQLELLHDSKGAAENEYWFKPFAAHLGLDGHIRGGGVSCINQHDSMTCTRTYLKKVFCLLLVSQMYLIKLFLMEKKSMRV